MAWACFQALDARDVQVDSSQHHTDMGLTFVSFPDVSLM